jgi:hypothetical protein
MLEDREGHEAYQDTMAEWLRRQIRISPNICFPLGAQVQILLVSSFFRGSSNPFQFPGVIALQSKEANYFIERHARSFMLSLKLNDRWQFHRILSGIGVRHSFNFWLLRVHTRQRRS